MDTEQLISKYTNKHSKFIELYGINIHYRDEGVGDVILLIHGTFSSLHTFDKWTEILSKNYRVVRLDLPGFGLTGPTIDNEYGIDLFVDYIIQFMNALEINKFSIAGNSLGGWLTWELALAHEDRLNKMILLNSAGYITDKDYPLPFVIAQTPVLRRLFNINVIPKVVVRRFIRQVFCDQKVITDEMIERYYDLVHRDGNMDAFARIANSKYKQNTHLLSRLKTPTLLLWGNKDNWIKPKHALYFQKDLTNVKMKIYDNVGHVPMEEIPEESVKDVVDFLKNN